MIKKYLEFIKESRTYEYGCLMGYFKIDNWNDIVSYIDINDLYKPNEGFGIEREPHITLLYGLHNEVDSKMIKNILDDFNLDFEITINGIDIFQNEEYDVVKFNVVLTKELKNINNSLRKLPHTNEYNEYSPHITIAYVKKGYGEKYVNKNYKYFIKNIDKIIYSTTSGDKIVI